MVDATCGTGQDTLFLARLVGEEGQVWAFDVQEPAVRQTRNLLLEKGAAGQVQVIHDSHTRIGTYVTGPIRAVMFNLGYLPGGDRQLITCGRETVAGLQQCMELLMDGGVVTVAAYTGHPGGYEEMAEVQKYFASMDQKEYETWQLTFLNQRNHPPCLLVCTRRGGENR